MRVAEGAGCSSSRWAGGAVPGGIYSVMMFAQV